MQPADLRPVLHLDHPPHDLGRWSLFSRRHLRSLHPSSTPLEFGDLDNRIRLAMTHSRLKFYVALSNTRLPCRSLPVGGDERVVGGDLLPTVLLGSGGSP
jgi:hypothetical protein